jgi:hypothetical protein
MTRRTVRRTLAVHDQRARAQERLERIRASLTAGIDSLAAADEAYGQANEAYIQAVAAGDWQTLGYPDLEAWRLDIRSDTRFETAARKSIVKRLTAIGKTVREIEAATGAGHATIIRDQAEASGPHGPQEIPEKPGQAETSRVPDGTQPQNARQRAARERETARRVRAAERPPEPVPAPSEPDPDDFTDAGPAEEHGTYGLGYDEDHYMSAAEILASIGEYLDTIRMLDLTGLPEDDRRMLASRAESLADGLRRWSAGVAAQRQPGGTSA